MNPAKADAISKWEKSRTVTQLLLFLGTANFYRQFIRNYSKITAPLDRVRKLKGVITWTNGMENAFLSLKKEMEKRILLSHLRNDQLFHLGPWTWSLHYPSEMEDKILFWLSWTSWRSLQFFDVHLRKIWIAKSLWEVLSIIGVPKIIQPDAEFVNQFIKEMSSINGIDHRTISAYNPRDNVERTNAKVEAILKKELNGAMDQWTDLVPYVQLAYNSKVESLTGLTPFSLMFGRSANEIENYGRTRTQVKSYEHGFME